MIDYLLFSSSHPSLQAMLLLPLAQNGVTSLVFQAGPFAKGVLIVLLLLSIIAWTITLNKYWQYRRFRRDAFRLLGKLRPETEPQALYAEAEQHFTGAISRIVEDGYRVLADSQDRVLRSADAPLASLGGGNIVDRGDHNIERELQLRLETAIEGEYAELEGGIAFLGSITNVSPFIGLLGTVWGVMGAFLGIGQSGNADLSVVAPGIAEALITTVAGLLVAIPAVFCHNFLAARLRIIDEDLNRLATTLNLYFANCWYREKAKSENRFRHQRDAAR